MKDENEEDVLDAEILHSSTREISTRKRLLEKDLRIIKSEHQRLMHEHSAVPRSICMYLASVP